MSQFSFFPQPDGTDPLADSLTQYRRSKKALGQRSPEDKRFMDLGRAFADMIGSVEPTNLLSIGGIAEEFGDVTKFIDRAKTINTRSDLEEELSSGILSPQESELKQQQIDVLAGTGEPVGEQARALRALSPGDDEFEVLRQHREAVVRVAERWAGGAALAGVVRARLGRRGEGDEEREHRERRPHAPRA
jgi:hypothetical protein